MRHSRGLSGVFSRQNVHTPTQRTAVHTGPLHETLSTSTGRSSSQTRPLRAPSMIKYSSDEHTRGSNKRRLLRANEELERVADELFNFLRALDFEVSSGHTLPRLAADPPTQSTIEGIFLFLRQQIDPNQTLGEGFKAAFLKVLRYTEYPGVTQIRKPSLANAPAIWPSVLDGLHWLMCVSHYTNQFRLGGEASKADRPMLDALFERNVSRQYQAETALEDPGSQFFQHDLNMGLERYIGATTEAIGLVESRKALVLSQSTIFRQQVAKFENIAVENSLIDTRLSHLQEEMRKLSTGSKHLEEKLSTLERRKDEIANKRTETQACQATFKARVSHKSGASACYTDDVLEDFLKHYRNTLLMQINELRELKSFSLKKSAILHGVEEKFEFVNSTAERYNLLADSSLKVEIAHVLSKDLGKSAKSLTGRTLFEIQKEIELAIVYHNNQIEQLRAKILKQEKAKSTLEANNGPILSLKLEMNETLKHKVSQNEAARYSLDNDWVLLAKWVGEVEEENTRSLVSTHAREANAQSGLEKAKMYYKAEETENLSSLSPVQDRLIERYDEFSGVYNQIGASFNGMLTASTQIVRSTEDDLRLAVFKGPPKFLRHRDVTGGLFTQYSSALSSRAHHA